MVFSQSSNTQDLIHLQKHYFVLHILEHRVGSYILVVDRKNHSDIANVCLIRDGKSN